MTLESIYYIGQTVAVIAILGSLIALIFQTRHTHQQNQRAIRQSEQANDLARAELTTRTIDVAVQIQNDIFGTEENASLIYRGMMGKEPLSREESFRFYLQMTNLLTASEYAVRLHQEGLTYDDMVERSRLNCVGFFRFRGTRQWWAIAREQVYIDPFRSWIDEIVAEIEAEEARDIQGTS
ncbi:hypothetical protein ACFFUB_09045 [Algimonas porphyrae]|uniref:DUF4760 domain-containing protein n=1 Tax=Algimonas porphyrae TaxID=1128113 RepID=A0ABQ5V4X9_9PROT|nr:hypothetical protein [Algimonas porphyrae]GLQ21740.1 hypothetical protein GCM10007854_26950 [Algimonas porphyrae]